MKPRISSCANVFERRGDSWMTRREGIEGFGRKAAVNAGVEDPDLDMFTRAKRAQPHFERGPDKPIREKSDTADTARRLANINRKMNAALSANQKFIKVKDTDGVSIKPPRPIIGVFKGRK